MIGSAGRPRDLAEDMLMRPLLEGDDIRLVTGQLLGLAAWIGLQNLLPSGTAAAGQQQSGHDDSELLAHPALHGIISLIF